MTRAKYASGAHWENVVGYSRAVRIGNIIEVAGTTAVDKKGKVIFPGNAYEQTKYILARIAEVLDTFGVGMEHVIRTRMYVTDIQSWEEVGRAHGEFFSDIRPASTMVEVSALIDPAMVVEVELTAVL